MKFKKIKARAIIIEKRKPIITLFSNLAFSASGPNIRAVKNENRIAENKGSNDIINPNAAPANAACDIQNPIDERFILTTKTPIVEHTNPARIEPIMDVNIKARGISIIIFYPLYEKFLL